MSQGFLKIPVSRKINKKIFKFNDKGKPQKRLTSRIFKNRILAASDYIMFTQ